MVQNPIQKMQAQIPEMVEELDRCIKNHRSEYMSLRILSDKLILAEFQVERMFQEISGMEFNEYLKKRKMAFILKEVRDKKRSLLELIYAYGFLSRMEFTGAFKNSYGVIPSVYRSNPQPVFFRTEICPFDRYLLGVNETGMICTTEDVKIYFVHIPAHKLISIKNDESKGTMDFWKKQSRISGQMLAYRNDPASRTKKWGIPGSKCWGVRLPMNYAGPVPDQMLVRDVPENDYIVFEPESVSEREKLEKIITDFAYEDTGYCIDAAPDRMSYFYFHANRYSKCIRPVRRVV